MEFEEVFIEGHGYRVPSAVADEIVNVRRGAVHEVLERIKAIDPQPTATIVITVPSNVSVEFQTQVAQVAKQNFPDHGIAVLPESLEMHTAEGLRELLRMGTEIATAVQDHSPELALEKADEFIKYVSRGGDAE